MTDRANMNLWVTPALKTAIRNAAARETIDTGERVSVQAWVRDACERKLGERDG